MVNPQIKKNQINNMVKYTIMIFGVFLFMSILFMYLMLSGNWNDFIFQLKWFLRITTPVFIIYLFYLGNKKIKND